jgi:hypothetical protein
VLRLLGEVVRRRLSRCLVLWRLRAPGLPWRTGLCNSAPGGLLEASERQIVCLMLSWTWLEVVAIMTRNQREAARLMEMLRTESHRSLRLQQQERQSRQNRC